MEIHTVPPDNLACTQDLGNSPCLIGAILEQDGWPGILRDARGRQPASIQVRAAYCQVPPRRTTNLAHRNTYLLTTCYLLDGRAEYSGESGIEGLTSRSCHLPSQRMFSHALMQTGYMHAQLTTHTHKRHTSRKQVPSVDKPPLLRVRRSLTWDQASIGENGGQHTTLWYRCSVEEEPTSQPGVNQQRTDPNSAQPCSVSQVSLFQGCRHGATGMGGHGMSKVK